MHIHHRARSFVCFTFYFEIIINSQKVGKIVQIASCILPPTSPSDNIFRSYCAIPFWFVVQNQETDIGTLLLTRLQTLFHFHHFLKPTFLCVCACVCERESVGDVLCACSSIQFHMGKVLVYICYCAHYGQNVGSPSILHLASCNPFLWSLVTGFCTVTSMVLNQRQFCSL